LNYSVAICTFNGEKYLEAQLESILNQSIKPKEIIICDDNSLDNTFNIAKTISNNWKDVNWIFSLNQTKLGYVKNFQKAIALCKHEIIFLSDQDDIWSPNKASSILEIFKNEEIITVFSDAQIVDENLNSLDSTMFIKVGFGKIEQENFSNEIYQMDLLLRKFIVTGATMAFRKKIVPIMFPIPETNFYIHDNWIATISSTIGKVDFIKEPLILYRQHNNNIIGAFNSITPNYPKNRYDLLIFFIKHQLNREEIIFNHLLSQNINIDTDKLKLLKKRITTLNAILKKKYFFSKLLLLTNVISLTCLHEFKSLRMYFGNSLIYLFKLN
jgi:glycosyltransferase involved in cell wall biosynthesis